MIVIYGTRFYGKVDNHGGQYQLTKFIHLYYVPVIPTETLWVTRHLDDAYQGHAVRMSGRSVLAGYARVWGPLVAVGALISGSGAAALVAGALVGLTAWTWTWRSLRDARERRRSDFHLAALGTRCDPVKMPKQLAESLQPHVAESWAQVSEGRTPEDIARLGAENPYQAIFAYASLRLAARLAPAEHARTARANSERVLDAMKDIDERALEGGPYRAAAQPQLPGGAGEGPGAP